MPRKATTEEKMPMIHRMKFVTFFLTVFLLLSGIADAQIIFLGRKALGKVLPLTGERKGSQQPGYDAATVLLEARAEKVYSTAINVLEANKDWIITQRNDKSRSLDFSDGKRTAGVQVSSLDEHLTQLLIVSAVTSPNTDTTSFVLNGVLRVCQEMGVPCQSADE
jgi:hypothetical protein